MTKVAMLGTWLVSHSEIYFMINQMIDNVQLTICGFFQKSLSFKAENFCPLEAPLKMLLAFF